MSSDPRAGSFQHRKDGQWNEYHGNGHPCDWQGEGHNHPVGGIHFDDEAERGKHSHAVHSEGRLSWHRHEGAYDACDDDDCDYSKYGRYRHGYRRPSRFSGDPGTWY